ncbi:MAG: hypothetical protein DME42_12250, partial [Verrucomicrobia bacterium]
LFQLVDQQLPALGPLPASMNQTVCGHDWEHNFPQNDAIRQAQAEQARNPKPESMTKMGAEIT